MSDCDGSLSSKSEPFVIESGSEYLPPQTPGRRSLISDFDSSDGDNTTTDKNSQNNNNMFVPTGRENRPRTVISYQSIHLLILTSLDIFC